MMSLEPNAANTTDSGSLGSILDSGLRTMFSDTNSLLLDLDIIRTKEDELRRRLDDCRIEEQTSMFSTKYIQTGFKEQQQQHNHPGSEKWSPNNLTGNTITDNQKPRTSEYELSNQQQQQFVNHNTSQNHQMKISDASSIPPEQTPSNPSPKDKQHQQHYLHAWEQARSQVTSPNLLNISPTNTKLMQHLSSSVLNASTLEELKRIHKDEMSQIKVHYQQELHALRLSIEQLNHQIKEGALEREAEMERIRAAADRTQQAMRQKYEDLLLQQRNLYLQQKEGDQRRLHEASQRHIRQLEQDFQNNQQTLALVVRELEDHIRHQDQQLQVKESQLAKKSIEAESLLAQVTALRQQTLDLQETVEKLRRENAQLNVNTFEGKSALQQLQDLKNQHVHLENAYNEENKRSKALQEELQDVLAQSKQDLAQLESERQSEKKYLQATIDDLKQKFAQTQEELQTAYNSSNKMKREHNSELLAVDERHKEVLAQIKQKLSTTFEHERNRLKSKLVNAEARAAEAATSLDRVVADRNRQVEALRSQAAVESQNLKARLQAEFDKQLETVHREHTERTQQFKQEVLTAKKMLQALQHQFQEERKLHAEAMASLSKQHDEACEVQQIQDSANQQQQKSRDEVTTLQQRLRDLDALRRKQLMELAAARDEEMSQFQLDHRRQLEQAEQRSVQLSEQLRSNMTLEAQQLRENVLREAEEQFQRAEDRWRQENARLKEQVQEGLNQLQNIRTAFSQDRQSLTDKHKKELQELRESRDKELEVCRKQLVQEREHVHLAKETIRKLKFEFERRLAQAQLQQQDALEGYISVDIKQQYEKTILALHQQIQILQERMTYMPTSSS